MNKDHLSMYLGHFNFEDVIWEGESVPFAFEETVYAFSGLSDYATHRSCHDYCQCC